MHSGPCNPHWQSALGKEDGHFCSLLGHREIKGWNNNLFLSFNFNVCSKILILKVLISSPDLTAVLWKQKCNIAQVHGVRVYPAKEGLGETLLLHSHRSHIQDIHTTQISPWSRSWLLLYFLWLAESHCLPLLISFSAVEVRDYIDICLKIIPQQENLSWHRGWCSEPQLKGGLWAELTIRKNKLYNIIRYQKQ